MTPGEATYLQFKANLVLKDISLTRWASKRGTGTQQVRAVVMTFAGSDKLPTHPLSRKILADVYKELADSPIPDQHDEDCVNV